MLIYQVIPGPYASDLNTTGVKLSVPLCESLKIVEYGFVSVATDPGAVGVLKLQYVDGAGNVVDLHSFTCPAAAAVSQIVSQRIDCLVDKCLNTFVVSISGTPGTITTDADGFGAVQLNATTAFGASITGTVYLKCALAGTPKGPATGQTLLTTI